MGDGKLLCWPTIRYSGTALVNRELMIILRLLFFAVTLSAFSAAQTKTITITIDDLPYAGMNQSMTSVIQARHDIRSITQTLKAHHVPAVAFVNEQKLQVPDQVDMRIGLLELWLDAGVPLGNHTYSHIDLNKNPERCAKTKLSGGR